jgi:hypothetical protein
MPAEPLALPAADRLLDELANHGPSTPLTITLCGSTRFWAELAEANLRFTVAGTFVLAPGVNMKLPHDLWRSPAAAEHLKQRLDVLHRRKIDRADHVVVVTDHTAYIGDSTRAEIAYAHQRRLPVWHWTPPEAVADHHNTGTTVESAEPGQRASDAIIDSLERFQRNWERLLNPAAKVEDWHASTINSTYFFTFVTLLEETRRRDPARADQLTHWLDEQIDDGSALGEWVHRWRTELAAGHEITLPETPRQNETGRPQPPS